MVFNFSDFLDGYMGPKKNIMQSSRFGVDAACIIFDIATLFLNMHLDENCFMKGLIRYARNPKRVLSEGLHYTFSVACQNRTEGMIHQSKYTVIKQCTQHKFIIFALYNLTCKNADVNLVILGFISACGLMVSPVAMKIANNIA
jgi:hypothetical protein